MCYNGLHFGGRHAHSGSECISWHRGPVSVDRFGRTVDWHIYNNTSFEHGLCVSALTGVYNFHSFVDSDNSTALEMIFVVEIVL